MPINGRPFLDFVLDSLASARCEDVGLVIGPDQRADFAAYSESLSPGGRRSRVTLLEQLEARGSADAVRSASDWAGDDLFLVLNGDNLYPTDALEALASVDGPGFAAFDREKLVQSSNIPPERLAAFAIVTLHADGTLGRIVEKPSREEFESSGGAMISMNLWKFDRRIFEACRDVVMSPRGEYELPSAVQLAIDRGVRFTAIHAAGPVLDLSSRVDVEAVEKRLRAAHPRPATES
jgi:glucose-1-phosphate thymidylyltransferase